MNNQELEIPQPTDRPWLYGLLRIPISLTGGFTGGVLVYLMSQRGIPVARSAPILSLLALPSTIYFLWSPLTDFFIRRRSWLIFAAISSGVFVCLGLSQKNMTSPVAIWSYFAAACLIQLGDSSCGGMMGALKSDRSKRLSSSFFMASNLAVGTVPFFVVIWLSERGDSVWIPIVAALMIAFPSLIAFTAPPQPQLSSSGFSETIRHIGSEFADTFFNLRAIPFLVTLAVPVTTGAALGLLPGIASSYGVSGRSVAWLGLGGALLSAAGAVTAARLPSHWPARITFCVLGLVNAIPLCLLALGPIQPWNYYIGVVLYAFTLGVGLPFYTTVILELIGTSGKSGSARYSICSALGNAPVAVMFALEGWGTGRWGVRGLAGTEAIVAILCASATLLYLTRLSKRTADPRTLIEYESLDDIQSFKKLVEEI